jgi:chloramphenicol O-acetyltransferase type B
MPRQSPFRTRNRLLGILRRIVMTWRKARVLVASRGRVTFGPNTHIAKNCDLRAPHGATIGRDVSIGKNFTCEVDLEIGADVLVSSNVSIVGNDHLFDDPDTTVYWQGRRKGDRVVLEGDNLVGFGTIIVGSVTLGRGCIVGAGSVVTRSLPCYSVCAGVPARVIRDRFPGRGQQTEDDGSIDCAAGRRRSPPLQPTDEGLG